MAGKAKNVEFTEAFIEAFGYFTTQLNIYDGALCQNS